MEVVFAWSLCLSVGVVLLSIIPLTIGRIKGGYSAQNMAAPRALFNELPDYGKRAVWCHQNCWESISIHAPACLLCLITLADSNLALIAAWAHPLLRCLYIGAYLLNIPIARGLIWASGIFATIILYEEGLTKLIKF